MGSPLNVPLSSQGYVVLALALHGACCPAQSDSTWRLSVVLCVQEESVAFEQPAIPSDVRVENQQVKCAFPHFWPLLPSLTMPASALRESETMESGHFF